MAYLIESLIDFMHEYTGLVKVVWDTYCYLYTRKRFLNVLCLNNTWRVCISRSCPKKTVCCKGFRIHISFFKLYILPKSSVSGKIMLALLVIIVKASTQTQSKVPISSQRADYVLYVSPS